MSDQKLNLYRRMFRVTCSREFLFEWELERQNLYRYALSRLTLSLFSDLRVDRLEDNKKRMRDVLRANINGYSYF